MEPHLAGSTLLVGIDFSSCCERALMNAVMLAEQRQAQLALVHVFEWNRQSFPASIAGPELTDSVAARLTDGVATQAQASLQQLAQLCSNIVGDRACAKIRVLVGEPVKGLLWAAAGMNASLIVLGALGRRVFPQAAVGSTAERVRADSNVPVFLVP